MCKRTGIEPLIHRAQGVGVRTDKDAGFELALLADEQVGHALGELVVCLDGHRATARHRLLKSTRLTLGRRRHYSFGGLE